MDQIPGMEAYVFKYYYGLHDKVILLAGTHILGLEDLQKIEITGSGDTTFDYVALFTFSLLSLLLAIGIYIFYYRILPIDKIFAGIIIYTRYGLGFILISYGLAKFWNGQFPGPGIASLEQVYGNFSPMGLAWRFFGYSETYKTFMGLAEIIPGVLLLFRRTSVLGALLAIAVTTNIVLVNFSFDVPVKLFSAHLLVFSLVILSPFAVDIFRFLILRQPVQLKNFPLPILNKRAKIASMVIKGVIIFTIPATVWAQMNMSNNFEVDNNEWEGVYTAQEASMNLLDSISSIPNLKKVIVSQKHFIGVNQQDESEYYQIKEIHENGKLDIYKYGEEETLYPVEIAETSGAYTLKGTIGENEYNLTTTRRGKTDYLLINRGFHWINEQAFNR